MEVRIGIQNSPRELGFESAEAPAAVRDAVTTAIEKGTKSFSLTDSDGRVYVVPTASIAYVEVGSERQRRVGFVG